MTNFEKYKDEILAIINKEENIAMANGILQECRDLNCNDCDFGKSSGDCDCNMMRWLYKEFCPFKRGERVILTIPGQPPLRCYLQSRKRMVVFLFFPVGVTNGVQTEIP